MTAVIIEYKQAQTYSWITTAELYCQYQESKIRCQKTFKDCSNKNSKFIIKKFGRELIQNVARFKNAANILIYLIKLQGYWGVWVCHLRKSSRISQERIPRRLRSWAEAEGGRRETKTLQSGPVSWPRMADFFCCTNTEKVIRTSTGQLCYSLYPSLTHHS